MGAALTRVTRAKRKKTADLANMMEVIGLVMRIKMIGRKKAPGLRMKRLVREIR
jgi:hypothetical protein